MNDLTQAEQNYVLADRSDPFTAARIRTHKRVGLCGPNDYSAREAWETVVMPDGERVQRRVWRELARP